MDLNNIKNIDIYLLDQLLKENINENKRILDAGCGTGRNLNYFIEESYNFCAFDSDSKRISDLKARYPNVSDSFICSDIEKFEDEKGFGFIICNAVLHFAKNHLHFDQLFENLVRLLNNKGILFIRMTSNIGLKEVLDKGDKGVYSLPDGSSRYLITRDKIDVLVEKYSLNLIEKVKTVNVDGLRCMTTLVFQK